MKYYLGRTVFFFFAVSTKYFIEKGPWRPEKGLRDGLP